MPRSAVSYDMPAATESSADGRGFELGRSVSPHRARKSFRSRDLSAINTAAPKEPPVRYLPPFETMKSLLNLTTARGKTRVDMTYEDLQKIIRALLSAIEVDEGFYLDRNPDVAQGIRNGGIRSAREHFIDHGYFEGRLPYRIEVDEAWYCQTHADIAETIRNGEYATGQAHFDGPGYPEGRAPFPPRP
jgi:hypothetical protein